jgi:outer membrane protein TolC
VEAVRRAAKVLGAEKELRQSEWNATLAQARLLQQQAYRSWNSLQTETLPLARQNLFRLRLAYEKGAVSYAEYLLQLRQLLSLENRILEAFLEYHSQSITIKSLLKQ